MRKKILIASFLKPVNDIRGYKKIAKSLAKDNSYSLYCMGYPSAVVLEDDNVQFLQLPPFNKRRFSRLYARWKAAYIYIKVKPELIIVNSPDLLIFSILYRIIFGGKIIYDIHENYFRNIWYQKNFIWGVKHIIAIIVRCKEVVTAPLFHHFFLAEKIYSTQLNFIKNRFTVLENKSLYPKEINTLALNKNHIKFLIAGTIAKEYGVFEGLSFFFSILKIYPGATLLIIGHCPNKSLLNRLNRIAKSTPAIRLKIKNNPVPYQYIENEILKAHIALLPYLPHKSTEGKWPTKVYEYSAYKLPFIIQDNIHWNAYIRTTNIGFIHDFTKNSDDKNQMKWLEIQSKEWSPPPPSNVYWDKQEESLLSVVNKYLKNIK